MPGKFDQLDAIQKNRSELDKALNLTSPEGFAEWLIAGHGLPESARSTIVSNLTESFMKERVKGSLLPLTGIDIEVRVFGFAVFQIRNRR
jgi:hypothetical protein